ncbi:78_t:CDS:2 [Funneliformis geosporum]|nr:78_t:CDS:2 [Funneliformis geosporum]
MRYEKFKVVVGSSKEYLLFYSTFFVDNNFQKKGEIYELVTPGNFVEDSTGIIQGIDNGAEKDLREKKEYVDKLSQETKSAKNETAELKKNFNILQDKKEKDDQKIKLLEEELARKKEAVEKENQK